MTHRLFPNSIKTDFTCRLLTFSVAVFYGFLGSAQDSSGQDQKILNRPPQFVLMAFDNCDKMNMWTETDQLASQTPVKFTYFLSSAFFLNPANRNVYQPARHPRGHSGIGISKSRQEVSERILHMERMVSKNHEMASHLNGHQPGASLWNLKEWESEFSQFKNFITNIFSLNGDKDSAKESAKESAREKLWKENVASKVVGFRAPFLEHNDSLFDTMSRFQFRYDTSKTGNAKNWPRRHPKTGTWLFPLANLVIHGTSKRTLSMDYNFYVAQTGAKEDPKSENIHSEQMYRTYLDYFNMNYSGNRAPVYIGHHFTPYHGGAYWRALQRFAKSICSKPEVKCVTYRELADFMDKNEKNISSYQAGNFQKLYASSQNSSFQNSFAQNSSAQNSSLARMDLSSHSGQLNLDQSKHRFHTIDVRKNGTEIFANWKTKKPSEISLLRFYDLNRVEIGRPISVPSNQWLKLAMPAHSKFVKLSIDDSRSSYENIEVFSKTYPIHSGGQLDSITLEERAEWGDLPEAHQ